MDFKQIEAFIKVVELASFSKAADELYVSQPSISHYITSLEKELHVVFINRSTKALSTTLAGERFLEKAKEMMALKREAIEMLKNLSMDISGEIRILASSVPALYILPQTLAAFHKLYPQISFNVRQADTLEVVEGIAAQSADIGFAGSIMKEKKCVFHEFTNEGLVFIAPNDGSYSKNKKYTLEELLYSNHFIAREFGSGTRMQYEKYFTENGILLDKIKTCASMDSTHSIINAVINGLGISIVSELAVRNLFEQKLLMPIELKTALPERKIFAVLNKSIVHSHLVELFMEYADIEAKYEKRELTR
ncbi:MAG: selenium metabolism-associated LysR family transcriptional regulator [Oscillospiraceae bacterium]|nr:selenium metabolism-associated LysR family transcriptional regulator [Oscillospiraceae bacterium]